MTRDDLYLARVKRSALEMDKKFERNWTQELRDARRELQIYNMYTILLAIWRGLLLGAAIVITLYFLGYRP